MGPMNAANRKQGVVMPEACIIRIGPMYAALGMVDFQPVRTERCSREDMIHGLELV